MGLVLEDARAGSVVNLLITICQNGEGGGREFSNLSYLTDKAHYFHHKYNSMKPDFQQQQL